MIDELPGSLTTGATRIARRARPPSFAFTSGDSDRMLINFDGWLGQQEEAVRKPIEYHLNSMPGGARESEKARLADQFAVSESTGIDLAEVNDNWDIVRGGFAEQQGAEFLAVKDDPAGFHGLLVKGAEKQRHRTALFADVQEEATAAALSIDPALADGEAKRVFAELAADPDYDPDDFPKFQQVWRETTATVRAKVAEAMPWADMIAGAMPESTSLEGGGPREFSGIAKGLADAGLSAEDRALIYELARQKIETRGRPKEGSEVGKPGPRKPDEADLLEGTAIAVTRGAGSLLRNVAFAAEGMVEGLGASSDAQARDIERILVGMAQGKAAPLDTSNVVKKALFGAGESAVPSLVIAAGPVGATLSFLNYHQESMDGFRDAGISGDKAYLMALPAALAKTMIDRVQWKWLGNVPGVKQLETALSGVANPVRYVAGQAAKGAGLVVAETAAEVAQDVFVDAATQQVAAWLKVGVRDPSWSKIVDEMVESAPDIILTMIPMVLAGVGIVGANDIRGVKWLLQNPELLRAGGFGGDAVARIMESENPMRELRLEWGKRTPGQLSGEIGQLKSASPSEVVQQAVTAIREQRDGQVEAARDTLAETPGVMSVDRTDGGWRIMRDDGTEITGLTDDAVPAALVEIGMAHSELAARGYMEVLDALHKPGAVTTLTGAEVEAEKGGQTTTVTPGMKAILSEKPADAVSELDAELELMGVDRATIGGSNFVREGVQHVVLNKTSRGVLTALHEHLESLFKAGAVSEQEVRAAAFVGFRLYENATDKAGMEMALRLQRISLGKASAAEAREIIVELAVANEVGRRKDGSRLPAGQLTAAMLGDAKARRAMPKITAFFKAVRAYFRAVFSAAAKLSKARREGQDVEALDRLTDKLLGIEEDRQHAEGVESEVKESFSLEPSRTPPGLNEKDRRLLALSLPLNEETQPNYLPTVDAMRIARTLFTEDELMAEIEGVAFGEGGTPMGDAFSVEMGARQLLDRYKEERQIPGGNFKETFSLEPAGTEGARTRRRILADYSGPERRSEASELEDGGIAWQDAKAEILHAIEIPEGLSRDVQTDYHTKWGSAYLYLRNEADESLTKISIRDHETKASFRGTEMDSNKVFYVPENATLTDWAKAADKVEKWLAENYAPESFSLEPAGMIERLAEQVAAKLSDPKERLEAYASVHDKLQGMARSIRFNDDVRGAVTRAEIDKERAAMRAAKQDELYKAIDAHFGDLSGAEFMAKAQNNPVIEAVFRPATPGSKFPRPRIRSQSAAIRAGKDTGGDYDGAAELPSWLFGGSLAPDQMAQELADAGLIGDAYPDTMWDAIASALKSAGVAKDRLADYARQKREAREQAATEAQQWASEQIAALPETQAGRERQDMLRFMSALDSLLVVLPPEVRAKIGGFTKLASLQTNKARADYVADRIEKMDRVFEAFLKKEYRARLDELIEKGQPTAKPGEKAKGKIGPEAHRFFREIAGVVALSEKEVEARQGELEKLLSAEGITDEEAADIFERQQVLDAFGNLSGKNASDLASALNLADGVYVAGRNRWRIQEEMRLAEVSALRGQLIEALGTGRYSKTQAQKGIARKITGKISKLNFDLKNFGGLIRAVLGENSPLAEKWSRASRQGFERTNDATRALRKEWDARIHAATGRRGINGRRAVWDMANEQSLEIELEGEAKGKTEKVPVSVVENLRDGTAQPEAVGLTKDEADRLIQNLADEKPLTVRKVSRGAGETVKMTEAEGIFVTMLARQEQYAGALDSAGFTADVLTDLESKLSDAAKSLREFMAEKYRTGYEPLNKLFSRMFGVDLPMVENYAPAAFYHTGDDKVKGPDDGAMPEGGFRAGFLKTRKSHAAAPKLENAFATFFGHQAQSSHWQSFAELVRELRGVFGNPDVKRAVEGAHGAEATAVINQWIKALEGNGIQKANGSWDDFTGWLLRQAAYVHLAWKVGTLAVQSTAALGSMWNIPARAYLKGMGKLLSGRLEVREMWHSDIIQRRLETGFAPEIRAALSDLWTAKPGMRQAFLEKGLDLIGWTDAFFTTASAAVAYDYHYGEALKSGLNESQARDVAAEETAETVAETAQPANVGSRSLFELRQGNLGKIAFMYASEARQKTALLLHAWSNTLTGKPTKDDFRVLALAHLIVGPLVQAIRSAWWDARDDDDDEWFDTTHWKPLDFLRAAMLGPLSGIPLLNDIFSGFKSNNAAVGRFADAADAGIQLFTGPAERNDEKGEWYWKRVLKVLQGLDAATASGAGIADQLFKVVDNLDDSD